MASGIMVIGTALGHSYLSETRLIRPVLAHPFGVLKGVVRQRLLRNVFHLPAMSWVIMGAMTIYFSLSPKMSNTPLYFALAIYVSALLANVQATRGWHIGWVLLLIDSGLLVMGLA